MINNIQEAQNVGSKAGVRIQRGWGAFDRLLDEAPYYPRCSSYKSAENVKPIEYAINYPWMQVNRQDWISWMVFDLDHDNAAIWMDKFLPTPNFVVRNRETNRAHLFYAIVPVYTGDKAKQKPINYYKAVYHALAVELEADLSYSGPVAKTPHHPWWNTVEHHSGVFSLGELAEGLELPLVSHWGSKIDLNLVEHSRHCVLFEYLRFYAYSVVNTHRQSGTFESFRNDLHNYSESINQTFKRKGFSYNLSENQVKATVKSVSRWTWNKYTGEKFDCVRGIMGLDDSLSVKERQKLSAERTHRVKVERSQNKIKAAVANLRECGGKVNQSTVALSSGLSRQTVAKYKDLLTSPQEPFSPPSSQKESHTPADSERFIKQIQAAIANLKACNKRVTLGSIAFVADMPQELVETHLTSTVLEPAINKSNSVCFGVHQIPPPKASEVDIHNMNSGSGRDGDNVSETKAGRLRIIVGSDYDDTS